MNACAGLDPAGIPDAVKALRLIERSSGDAQGIARAALQRIQPDPTPGDDADPRTAEPAAMLAALREIHALVDGRDMEDGDSIALLDVFATLGWKVQTPGDDQ